MKRTTNIALLLAIMVFGFCVYGQAISVTIGTGDYYSNVGDYDYLPYAYGPNQGSQYGNLNFQSVMGEYGTWVSIQPFGQVWRPYVAQGWRPYTQGHWNYTQYGPTWEGYEPWAWAGYHYGNWIYNQQYGWVWIPGYEYHPGRVAWSQGYNSIGWTPMPPSGYDYSRGYLSQVGPQNQFTYYDDDFSIGVGFGGGNDYYYGGPYYDPRYRNMYYNNSYLNLANILWTFIDPNHFGNDNYADYYYGDDYARYLFDRRLIRISSRPIDRVVLERVVRQPIVVRQVQTNEIEIDGRRVRIAAVEGEQDKVRKNANRVVRETIAPAFVEKGKEFKGDKARNRAGLNRALRQENTQASVETVTSDQIVREATTKRQQKEQQRAQIKERKREELVQVEKQGKIKEKKDKGLKQTETEDNRSRSTRVTPEPPRNQPVEEQNKDLKQKNRPAENENLRRNKPVEDQQTEEQKDKVKRNRPVDQEQEENLRLKEKDRQSTIRPDDEQGVQKDIERERQTKDQNESEVKKTDTKKDAEAKDAESDKSKKAKSKKSKDKDKDKKQNQDEPPQD